MGDMYHVQGLTLVAEGIDGASRGGSELGEDANVETILGPAFSDELWRSVSVLPPPTRNGAGSLWTPLPESN